MPARSVKGKLAISTDTEIVLGLTESGGPVRDLKGPIANVRRGTGVSGTDFQSAPVCGTDFQSAPVLASAVGDVFPNGPNKSTWCKM